MIHIAIVDDDAHDRKELKSCLLRYEKEKQLKFKVSEYTDGEDIVTRYSADYDIILLDIEMTFLNGMKAAEKIREMDRRVILIFITNMPQYAIRGYKVGALDYMLKPISWFSFCETMNRAVAGMLPEEKQYLTLTVKGGRMKLDVSRLCYVEVQDHQMIYHTLDEAYVAKGTIRDVEDRLDGRRFFRCNRCYIVNLEMVENYVGSSVAVHGDTILVSRNRRKPFLDALNAYLSEVGR